MSVLTTKDKAQFYSSFNYLLALRKILNDESEKRIIKKIKKLTHKEALVFLKKWKHIFYERAKKTEYIRQYETQQCNNIIEVMHEEFRLLGIRIP